jgi:NTP pyrophosphatase (non-canonical NTP hydrolase)
MMTINELMQASYDNAASHGWVDDRSFGDHIALMHSELSEALEEFRNGHTFTEVYYNPGNPDKPEGIPMELADVVIRVAQFCKQYGIDLEDAIRVKGEYNQTRQYRHGGKVI